MGWYIMATVDILWQSQEAVFYSVKNFSWPCKNVPDVTCKNVPDVNFGPYKIDKIGMSRGNCSSSSRGTFFLLSCGPLKQSHVDSVETNNAAVSAEVCVDVCVKPFAAFYWMKLQGNGFRWFRPKTVVVMGVFGRGNPTSWKTPGPGGARMDLPTPPHGIKGCRRRSLK